MPAMWYADRNRYFYSYTNCNGYIYRDANRRLNDNASADTNSYRNSDSYTCSVGNAYT